MRVIALFLALTIGMFAADRRSIAEVGKKVDHATAKAMGVTADSLLGNTIFPQAPGIISIQGNGTQYQVDFILTSVPADSYIGGEIIDPSGEAISTETWYFSQAVNGEVVMELWNGAFPQAWPNGVTQFRMFVITGGNPTEANAYVSVNFCCTSNTAPQVTSIALSSDGTQFTVMGQFSAAPTAGVNGIPAKVISGIAAFSSTTGVLQGTVVIANPTSLNNGNGVLTLCDQSSCSQTNFNIPPPSPTNGKG